MQISITRKKASTIVFYTAMVGSCIGFMTGMTQASVSDNPMDQSTGLNLAAASVVASVAALLGQVTPWIKEYFNYKREERDAQYRYRMSEAKYAQNAERVTRLERKLASMASLVKTLRDVVVDNRDWILNIHAKYPDVPLPANFGKRMFDGILSVEDILDNSEDEEAKNSDPESANGGESDRVA